MNGKMSKEAESNFDKQADEAPAEEFTIKGQNSEPHPNAKRVRIQKELTFQDMYENQDMFDQDDNEDSDWEPMLHKSVEVTKWFCKNCTMVNVDIVDCCEICGEHKDSKILSYGCFASPFAPDKEMDEIQPNLKGARDLSKKE